VADLVERLEGLLAGGRDDPLLRFSLGAELLKRGDAAAAARHLREATARQPDYSAAWKLLGQALGRLEAKDEAIAAFRRGIEVADARGDRQAGKEMRVFLRRLEKIEP